MNKPIILILLLVFPYSLFAQITIDQNDMPQSGDTIRLSSAIDFENLNYEDTGNDFVWDFSELSFFSQRVDTFVSVSQTPWLYQIVFLLSANLASPGLNFDQLPGFQVSDYFNYYKNSSAQYKSVGFGVTMNSIPIPNKFNDPDIIYRFPLSYGEVDSSLSNFELNIPGLGYYGGWKKRVNHADGWGELITPYGTFETIRIKSDIIQFDSLYIDSLGFGFPILRNYTEYKWLGKDFGLPLCTVTDDGLLPTIEYIDSVRSFVTTSVYASTLKQTISVKPNPFMNSITICLSDVDSDVDIRIFNLNGEMVYTSFSDQFSTSNDIRTFHVNNLNLPVGIYLLNVRTKEENFIHKIIKSN